MHQSFARILRERGYKLTAPRKIVVDWIAGHTGIFSAKELLKQVKKADKVSVYRTLDLLSDLDLIHPVLNQHGEVHYEVHGTRHHHHAVCVACEKTACVPCTIKEKRVSGFSTLHHSFVMTGVCVGCA